MRILIGILLIAGIFGCSNKGKTDSDMSGSRDIGTILGQGSGNSYARGFSIKNHEHGFELTLLDPWNSGKIYDKYLIINDQYEKISKSDSIKVIVLPLQRWAVSSTTHIGFLNALGEAGRVVGCTSPDRVYDSLLYERFKNDSLLKIGSDMEYNFESVLGIEPDIILQTAFDGQQQKDRRFHSAGLNFLYILEWMEPHPLGRAEWIKVFGLLCDKKAEADSIFNIIATDYNQLKSTVGNVESKPLVMFGNNFNGTWFMPGGQNYMCRFLEDAGFSYPFLNSEYRGSLALNFENVLDQFRTSKFWLGVSAREIEDLLKEDSRYSLFEPLKNHQVYSVNGRINSGMGNDYWESGVVYPNLILADLVSIAHPEIMDSHKLIFYKQLTDGK